MAFFGKPFQIVTADFSLAMVERQQCAWSAAVGQEIGQNDRFEVQSIAGPTLNSRSKDTKAADQECYECSVGGDAMSKVASWEVSS